ncbi:WD-40 repeat protein, partial [Reticulomyxa filosa]
MLFYILLILFWVIESPDNKFFVRYVFCSILNNFFILVKKEFIDFERKKNVNATIIEEEIQKIIQQWIRTLKIKLGWIQDFDKLIIKYVTNYFMFEIFRSSSKLLNTLTGHTRCVWSIDYSAFDNNQFICSGSSDNTVRVWDIENSNQIESFHGHSSTVFCVKFSPYHYYNNCLNVICSSAYDKTIRFWDFKHDRQLKLFNNHTQWTSVVDIYVLDLVI